MKKLLLISMSMIILSPNIYANIKKTVRGQGGMVISIGQNVMSIGSEGRVVGIDTSKRIIDVEVTTIDSKTEIEHINARDVLVLKEANVEYVDANGIEKIKKNSLVSSSVFGGSSDLSKARVINIYENGLIRLSSMLDGSIESTKVVNASDVEVLIPTKRGVKGWNREYSIYKGTAVIYNGDAIVLETYKNNKAEVECLSSGEVKILSSLELSLNKGMDQVKVSRRLGSEDSSKESIEDLF